MNKPPTHAAVRQAVFQPPRAYRWLSPEAAMRYTLECFFVACRFEDRSNEQADAEPEHLSCAEGFIEYLTDMLKSRLCIAADDLGEMQPEVAAHHREHFENYYEPMWLSHGETPRSIHCRASQNGSRR